MNVFLFPELPRGAAQERLAEVRRASVGGVEGLKRIASAWHPRAYWPPTGGRAAQEADIHALSEAVRQDLSAPPPEGWLSDEGNRSFDLRLGRSLHENLRVSPAAASREGMWSFLTLVVFPECLYERFPQMPDDRAFGTHRNVLRRVWLRYEVLGEVLHRVGPNLREDEFVQILERTALVRTPALARSVAEEVLLRPPGAAREAFTRALAKEVVRRSGPLLLDALAPDELRGLVSDCAAHV